MIEKYFCEKVCQLYLTALPTSNFCFKCCTEKARKVKVYQCLLFLHSIYKMCCFKKNIKKLTIRYFSDAFSHLCYTKSMSRNQVNNLIINQKNYNLPMFISNSDFQTKQKLNRKMKISKNMLKIYYLNFLLLKTYFYKFPK